MRYLEIYTGDTWSVLKSRHGLLNGGTEHQPAKLVLIALVDCSNSDTGQCDPCNAYLAGVV